MAACLVIHFFFYFIFPLDWHFDGGNKGTPTSSCVGLWNISLDSGCQKAFLTTRTTRCWLQLYQNLAQHKIILQRYSP